VAQGSATLRDQSAPAITSRIAVAPAQRKSRHMRRLSRALCRTRTGDPFLTIQPFPAICGIDQKCPGGICRAFRTRRTCGSELWGPKAAQESVAAFEEGVEPARHCVALSGRDRAGSSRGPIASAPRDAPYDRIRIVTLRRQGNSRHADPGLLPACDRKRPRSGPASGGAVDDLGRPRRISGSVRRTL
jgi:hypothetical protein